MAVEHKPESVNLPPRLFLYTVDQISTITQISGNALHATYLFHEGRDVGVKQRQQMSCKNIASPEAKPDWRIAEAELITWLKRMGFKLYERGYIK